MRLRLGCFLVALLMVAPLAGFARAPASAKGLASASASAPQHPKKPQRAGDCCLSWSFGKHKQFSKKPSPKKGATKAPRKRPAHSINGRRSPKKGATKAPRKGTEKGKKG